MVIMPGKTILHAILKWAARGAALLLLLAACVAGGLVYGWTQVARALPPLQGWHLQAPPSEFTAADARPGYDFEAYRRQESRVFTELEELMAGPWSGEARGRFNRFRTESACNPATLFPTNWNRTFVLESPAPVGGALLVHGLSDAPYSLRAIAERLHGEGYTVVGLRVPGHGTSPAALAKVSKEDWTAAVRVAAAGLRRRIPGGAPLVMVGYSNGGALSVHYALEALADASLPRPQAIVLFSPMIGITRMAAVTRLHRPIAALSGEARAHWSSLGAEIDPFKYGAWPMNASVQAFEITRRVEQRLAALEQAGRTAELPPILAFQSAVDSTVITPRLITQLFDRVARNGSELVLFDVNRAGWLDNLVNLNFEQRVLPALRQTTAPFALTLVTNASSESLEVVAQTRSGDAWSEVPLGESWPPGVFSLSHVAVPFPSDDPLYGTAEATRQTGLPLGSLSARGESGVLKISDGQLLRLRHNPFYEYTENHCIEWLQQALNRKGS
jgi:alpha-beta hydrolase superfamily lysophospholipase